MEMLADINKDTVDFEPNFDETEKEPVVLPSRYPNLLVNGTSGIAVGMATNIPPHNLREVVDAVVKIMDNRILEDRDTEIEEIMGIVKAPDFRNPRRGRGIPDRTRQNPCPRRDQYRDASKWQEPDHRDGASLHGKQGEAD